MIWIFMESEEPETKSKQTSKRSSTLFQRTFFVYDLSLTSNWNSCSFSVLSKTDSIFSLRISLYCIIKLFTNFNRLSFLNGLAESSLGFMTYLHKTVSCQALSLIFHTKWLPWFKILFDESTIFELVHPLLNFDRELRYIHISFA